MKRAPVVSEPSPYTGRPRLRCKGCGKVAFATDEIAKDAADRIEASQGQRMDVYLGPGCGWYHLSRADRDGSATFHPHQEDIARQ